MGKISNFFNFEDIGKKIKDFAKWSCWITILLIWIAAPIIFIIFLTENNEELCLIPIIAAIVVPFLVWVGSWTIYAFGELVERAASIDNKIGMSGNAKSQVQSKIDNERIAKLEKLRAQGLITEEEYQAALNK